MLVFNPVFLYFSCHNLRFALQIKNDLVEVKDTLWDIFPSCLSLPSPAPLLLMCQIVPHKANGWDMDFEGQWLEVLLCLMSESPGGKREGFQDNAIRKKGSLLLTRVRASAATNAVVQGQRARSPSCYTNL